MANFLRVEDSPQLAAGSFNIIHTVLSKTNRQCYENGLSILIKIVFT